MLENEAQQSRKTQRSNAPWPSGEIGLGGGAFASAAAVANPSTRPPPPPPPPSPSEPPRACPELGMTLPLASASELASIVVGATGPLLCIRPVVTEQCHRHEDAEGRVRRIDRSMKTQTA